MWRQLPIHSTCWHFPDSLAVYNAADSAFVELITVTCCFVMVFHALSVERMESIAVSQLDHPQVGLHVIISDCLLKELDLNYSNLMGS